MLIAARPVPIALAALLCAGQLGCRSATGQSTGEGMMSDVCECPSIPVPDPIRVELPCGVTATTAALQISGPCVAGVEAPFFDAGVVPGREQVLVGYPDPPIACTIALLVDGGAAFSANVEVTVTAWYPCGSDPHGCGPRGYVLTPAVVTFGAACGDAGAGLDAGEVVDAADGGG